MCVYILTFSDLVLLEMAKWVGWIMGLGLSRYLFLVQVETGQVVPG